MTNPNVRNIDGLPAIMGQFDTFARTTTVRAMADAGITVAKGSFEQGVTGVTQGTGVYQESTGKVFQWQLTNTFNITAGTLPTDYGTVGTDWVDRTDLTLRSEINIVQKRFSCVTDMIADTSLGVGQIVETIGYYNGWVATVSKPKGGNRYEIVSAGTGTADGGSFITLSNGLQAKGLFTGGSISAEQFGAYGDYSHNDTVSLNNAWAYSGSSKLPLIHPSNTTYLCSITDYSSQPDCAVNAASDAVVYGNNSTYRITANAIPTYAITLFTNCSNVTVYDLQCYGDQLIHDYSSGGSHEWGYGFRVIDGANNVSLIRCSGVYTTGDGFITSSSTGNAPKNIVMDNCLSEYCRRQGLSIEAVDGLHVKGKFTARNISGAAPSSAIDIEPSNNTTHYVHNCIIDAIYADTCAYGLSVFLNTNMTANSASALSVDVHIGKVISKNCNMGVDISFSTSNSTYLKGMIAIDVIEVDASVSNSVRIREPHANAPFVKIGHIYSSNSPTTNSSILDAKALVAVRKLTTFTRYIDNVSIGGITTESVVTGAYGAPSVLIRDDSTTQTDTLNNKVSLGNLNLETEFLGIGNLSFNFVSGLSYKTGDTALSYNTSKLIPKYITTPTSGAGSYTLLGNLSGFAQEFRSNGQTINVYPQSGKALLPASMTPTTKYYSVDNGASLSIFRGVSADVINSTTGTWTKN